MKRRDGGWSEFASVGRVDVALVNVTGRGKCLNIYLAVATGRGR